MEKATLAVKVVQKLEKEYHAALRAVVTDLREASDVETAEKRLDDAMYRLSIQETIYSAITSLLDEIDSSDEEHCEWIETEEGLSAMLNEEDLLSALYGAWYDTNTTVGFCDSDEDTSAHCVSKWCKYICGGEEPNGEEEV